MMKRERLPHNNRLKHASEEQGAVEEWPRLDYHFVVPTTDRKQLAEGMSKSAVRTLSRSPYKEHPFAARTDRKRKQPTPTKMPRGVCLVDDDKSDLYYVMEKIIRKRWHEEGFTEYLVKWEKENEPTWEPASSLPDAQITAFERAEWSRKRQKQGDLDWSHHTRNSVFKPTNKEVVQARRSLVDKLQSRKDNLSIESNSPPSSPEKREHVQRLYELSRNGEDKMVEKATDQLEIHGAPPVVTKKKGQPNPSLEHTSKVLLPSHEDMRLAVKPRASVPAREKLKGRGSQPTGKLLRSPFASPAKPDKPSRGYAMLYHQSMDVHTPAMSGDSSRNHGLKNPSSAHTSMSATAGVCAVSSQSDRLEIGGSRLFVSPSRTKSFVSPGKSKASTSEARSFVSMGGSRGMSAMLASAGTGVMAKGMQGSSSSSAKKSSRASPFNSPFRSSAPPSKSNASTAGLPCSASPVKPPHSRSFASPVRETPGRERSGSFSRSPARSASPARHRPRSGSFSSSRFGSPAYLSAFADDDEPAFTRVKQQKKQGLKEKAVTEHQKEASAMRSGMASTYSST